MQVEESLAVYEYMRAHELLVPPLPCGTSLRRDGQVSDVVYSSLCNLCMRCGQPQKVATPCTSPACRRPHRCLQA